MSEKKCTQTHVPEVDNSAIYCKELISTDCVIHSEDIPYLDLPEDSTTTEIIDAIVADLEKGGVPDDDSQFDGVPNGNGTYTWVKYGTDINGAGITDSPTAETLYIGLAYNKTTPVESNNPEEYIWGLIDGENYWTDDNGVRHYTWVKYADTPISGISDEPLGKAYIGLAYDKPTGVESEIYSDYIWSKILSNSGTDGVPQIGTNLWTWIKYADTIDGTGISDSPVDKLYIGFAYNKDTFIESDDQTDYTWGLINGENVDGNGKYTWVKYADTPVTGISDSSIGKLYIGLTFNKDTSLESDIYTDYQWSLLTSNANGDIDNGGLPTPTENLFTWIKFADDINGAGLDDSPVGKTHIGLAFNKSTETESIEPTDYFWNLIEGSQPYVGADGETYYIWTKYSNSPDGSNLSDSPINQSYIGLAYNKLTPTESANPLDYEWVLFLGEGIVQQPKWLYTWIKFADDINGAGLSDFPDGKEFMGLAYDKDTPAESLDPLDYVWNPIRGDQGYIGPDGKTYYTWVKYALTPNSVTLLDSPTGMKWMGMAFNKDTSVESGDYTDYTWYPFSESDGSGDGTIPTAVNQNNLVRVIKIPMEDLTSLDEEGLAIWINENGLDVYEDENVVFEITGYTPPNSKVLDVLKELTLSVPVKTTTTADLIWNPNGDDSIVRYDIFYVPTKGGVYTLISLGNVTSNTLTGLETGTEYNVYVLAYDTSGNIKKSNIVTFSTVEVFTALTPNIQVDGVTDETVDLSWNMETSFNVDRWELYLVDGGGDIKIYDGVDKSFQHIDLESETTYQYYVIGFSGVTASTQSATVSATTLEAESPPLTAPIITFLGNSLYTIIIGISVPYLEESIITGYVIEYRILGTTNWIIINGENETVQTLTGLNSGTTYEIRLRSTTDLIYSDYSNTLVASTLIDPGADIKVSLLDEPVQYFEGKSKFRYPINTYTSPNFGTGSGGGFVAHPIQKGMSIRINIRFSAKGSIKYSVEYDKTFIVAADYANTRDWFEAEVGNLGSFGDNYTWNGVDDIGGNVSCGAGLAETNNYKSGYGFGQSASCANGIEQFWVVPHRKGTASRDVNTFVAFTFQPNGVIIIKNGIPSSSVKVNTALTVRNSANQSIFGYIILQNSGSLISNNTSSEISYTLDSNGEFIDNFSFDASEPGTRYTISSTIIQSENGVNPTKGTSQLTYTKT